MKQAQRDYAKQIIRDCQIKRLSRAETLDMLKTKGLDISEATLTRFKADMKKEAREWITHLAKDRDEYIAQYKQSVDTYRLLQYEAFKILNDPMTRAFVKIQALLAIGKFESDITDLVDAQPVVMALKDYTGLSAESNAEGSKEIQQ